MLFFLLQKLFGGQWTIRYEATIIIKFPVWSRAGETDKKTNAFIRWSAHEGWSSPSPSKKDSQFSDKTILTWWNVKSQWMVCNQGRHSEWTIIHRSLFFYTSPHFWTHPISWTRASIFTYFFLSLSRSLSRAFSVSWLICLSFHSVLLHVLSFACCVCVYIFSFNEIYEMVCCLYVYRFIFNKSLSPLLLTS